MCKCRAVLREGYMTHHGIRRKTLRCSSCGELQDYYPQYLTDNITCSKCGKELDFASNPIGEIVRFSDTDIRIYCKPCINEIEEKLKTKDLSILEEESR